MNLSDCINNAYLLILFDISDIVDGYDKKIDMRKYK